MNDQTILLVVAVSFGAVLLSGAAMCILVVFFVVRMMRMAERMAELVKAKDLGTFLAGQKQELPEDLTPKNPNQVDVELAAAMDEVGGREAWNRRAGEVLGDQQFVGLFGNPVRRAEKL